MSSHPIKPRPRIRTKAIAAKVLLSSGETIRSTAEALGIDKGTVLALSKQQILSDTELVAMERINAEKMLRVEGKALDLMLKPGVLEKLNGNGLSSVVKDMRKARADDKPDTRMQCNTLMLAKYIVGPSPDPLSISTEIEGKEDQTPQPVE